MTVYALIIAYLTTASGTSQTLYFKTLEECKSIQLELAEKGNKISTWGCFKVVK